MFNFFKRNKKKRSNPSPLVDLDGNLLQLGDRVMALRYELGECIIIEGERGISYRSVADGKCVSWHLMVDANTECQKVKKISAGQPE